MENGESRGEKVTLVLYYQDGEERKQRRESDYNNILLRWRREKTKERKRQ